MFSGSPVLAGGADDEPPAGARVGVPAGAGAAGLPTGSPAGTTFRFSPPGPAPVAEDDAASVVGLTDSVAFCAGGAGGAVGAGVAGLTSSPVLKLKVLPSSGCPFLIIVTKSVPRLC